MDRETERIYEVELTGMTYGGDTIGRLPDGRVIFVPYGITGEKVRVRVVKEKRGYARGEFLEVITPSPDRIVPRCIHYGVCGGCHYQHMRYSRQLRAKTEIIREQLARFGGISNPPLRPIVPSPSEWYYRNHIQFHLDPEGRLGYLAADSHRVVPIQECHLPDTLLNTIWPELELEPIPGLEKVDLRMGRDEEVQLILEGNDPQAPEMTMDLPLSVIYAGPGGNQVLGGEEGLIIDVLGRAFQVSAGSFFQVNTPQAEAMVRYILDHQALPGKVSVLDIYCGAGLFSAFLAERAGRLIGVESSPQACGDFAINLDSFDNVELYQGTAESILPALDLKPDLVICDPPRTGIDRRALQAILSMHPSQVFYVSCDPTTLARDLRLMNEGGYHLEEVTPFDLFPQTYHIESISWLSA